MADLPPLPDPNEPFVNPQTGLVNPDWYRWLQAFSPILSELSEYIESVEGDLPGKAGLTQVDDWSHFIVKVANGDVVMKQKAPFAGSITSTVTDCDSGTCTATFKIDGVTLGGAANSISTTETDQPHTTTNAFTAGQTISYTLSANSSCLGARVQINYTRNLAA